MENEATGLQPVLSHAEPVLAVKDISETISYWQDVLGFPAKWTWGDPPNHGGVSWQGVFIQFTLDPALAASSKGNSIWIRVQRVEILYNFHQQKNATIVAPLKNQPWGMAEYTIREINGYYIHFAGPVVERAKSMATLPPTVRIIGRIPTVQEYQHLGTPAAEPSGKEKEEAERKVSAAITGVVAEDTNSGEVIGYALLLGDHASFYYVKDVLVHPDWQGKRIGSAMMKELTNWLEKHAANNALVALICRETLEPFYQQFGFGKAFSMIRYIHHANHHE